MNQSLLIPTSPIKSSSSLPMISTIQHQIPTTPRTFPYRTHPIKQESLPSSFRASHSGLETPFEVHLQEIYSSSSMPPSGLEFFESHGYYDLYEANTVAMFRENFGMKTFWDGTDLLEGLGWDENDLDDISMSFSLSGHSILNVGSLVLKNSHRKVQPEQLDEDGCSTVDLETENERLRADRLRRQSYELDEDDLNTLAKEQAVLETAITVIRTEKLRFRHYFFQAFQDQMEQKQVTTKVSIPEPLFSITLPPFSGYLYLLKDTIPHVFRSWHKRWLYLDFTTGLILFFKRSYWKRERGILDLRTIARLKRTNPADLRIECFDGHTMLLRSKTGRKEADLWWNLIQFARQHVQQRPPSTCIPMLEDETFSKDDEDEENMVLSNKIIKKTTNPSIMDFMSTLCKVKTASLSNPAA